MKTTTDILRSITIITCLLIGSACGDATEPEMLDVDGDDQYAQFLADEAEEAEEIEEDESETAVPAADPRATGPDVEAWGAFWTWVSG
jgi:hypothetical protein